MTVREAAGRASRSPETIRRWIREGKLLAAKVGAHHTIDEADLENFLDDDEELPLPPEWARMPDGRPMPNVVAAIRRSRRSLRLVSTEG